MKKIPLFLVFIFLATKITEAQEIVIFEKENTELANDYAKIVAYNQAVNFIVGFFKENFENYSANANKLLLEWELFYKPAEAKLITILKERLNSKDFEELIIRNANSQYNKDSLDRALKVNIKSNNRDPLSLLNDYNKIFSIQNCKEVLAYYPAFYNKPTQEINNEYFEVFKSLDYEKSNQLNFSFKYPKSWHLNEGQNKTVLAFVKSKYSAFNMGIGVEVKPFLSGEPQGVDYTTKMFIEYYGGDAYKKMIKERYNFSILRTADTKIYGETCKIITREGILERVGSKIESRSFTYHILKGNYIISVDFNFVSSLKTQIREKNVSFIYSNKNSITTYEEQELISKYIMATFKIF